MIIALVAHKMRHGSIDRAIGIGGAHMYRQLR